MNKLKIILPVLLLAIITGSIYFSFEVSPDYISIKNYTIQDNQAPTAFNDFTIGYISDLNLNIKNDLNKLETIIHKINEQNYNMVLFGGDLYDTKIFNDTEVTSLLKEIKTTHGKFAVLGEKDIAYEIDYILEEGGFEILHNNHRTIYYNDAKINLFGLEANANLTGLLTEEHQDNFSIALIHQPDYVDEIAKYTMNLQLSGHSNGGYINIPFLGGMYKKDGATNYINGNHTILDTTLLISNGLGNETNVPYRINNPCQILTISFNN